MNPSLKFAAAGRSNFLFTLKQRVDNYFSGKQISRHANPFMILKTVVFLSFTILLYGLLISSVLPLYLMLPAAMLIGISMAFIGFNICHDALHGSYSSNKKVNRLLGFIFNIIGANTYVWNITHNIVHHSYTNIVDHDEDIEIAPGLIRINDTEPIKKMHRYQHIYAFFLYCLTTLSWFFRKDYLKFFKNNIGSSHVNKHPRREYINLFLYKAIYYGLFIVLPLLLMDISWWQFIIGFLAMNFAEGLVLGLVFQVAHVVENTDMPQAAESGRMENSWAEHQLHTTANFAPRSRLASFFCGGLNLQIEHHLFPKVCHVHYRHLSAIVQATALEFNLPYHVNKTFAVAIRSHYQFLKKAGRPGL
jgi:linoleoyl-CoA desaturase